jgi:hypothetical protein
MPYGDDITEGLPYVLSNPAGSTTYSLTGEAYDVAIAGNPFFLMTSDDAPYRRVTAQYRKQQIDQTREAGEQTLTGWWVRSQSSFHLGAGIKYFEPQQEESLRFQYTESKGIDIWTRGQATLLNDTASFYSGSAAAQIIGVNDGTNDCILVTDGTALKKITTGGSSSTYTQAGTASTIYSLTTNGKEYFFINGSHVHRGNISGSTSDTEIYNASSTTRATIRYVKQRLIAAIGSSIYELNPNHGSGALPTAFFTHPPCNAIAFKDSYAYIATLVDGAAGLVRVDLSTTVLASSLFFPWAWDLIATGTTTTASQVAFFGNSDRAAFTNGNNVWAESTTLVASGYLRTGYIRYNTLEAKIFKLMQARVDTANGGILIESVDSFDNFYTIGNFSQGSAVPEVNINYPQTAQEYLGFQFTLSRSTTDTSKGPLFTGYQLKSLPAVPRQRLIQYPLSCFDHESDSLGVEIGYEGSAYARMAQLEAIESNGDSVQIQDFRTGESYIGLIEEMDFINRTPSDKRFSGYGGLLLVTIRSL